MAEQFGKVGGEIGGVGVGGGQQSKWERGGWLAVRQGYGMRVCGGTHKGPPSVSQR